MVDLRHQKRRSARRSLAAGGRTAPTEPAQHPRPAGRLSPLCILPLVLLSVHSHLLAHMLPNKASRKNRGNRSMGL